MKTNRRGEGDLAFVGCVMLFILLIAAGDAGMKRSMEMRDELHGIRAELKAIREQHGTRTAPAVRLP